MTILAPTPPMGWNSWNSFATTITEAQALETAAIMAAKLLPFGYDVFTIDIQWYEPGASSYEYSTTPKTTMDAYGRVIPAPNRFPSSANGVGFAEVGRKVHALGLKFGIHIMRGIPRGAVEQNTPIAGSGFHAADAADTSDACPWDDGNYGIRDNAAGQAYYDSVIKLYATWGVDFLKVDCIADHPYKAAEIRQTVVNEAHSAGTHNDDRIRGVILAKAREDNLPITAEDITIVRGNGEITVTVDYTVPIQFPGYTYNWHLHPEERAPIVIF